MPSRLGLLRRPSSIASLRSLLDTEERELMNDGWFGYVPSIEPALVGLGAMYPGSYGLLPRGETLIHEVGWSRVDPTRLPLGDNGAGAAATPAAGANAQPIQHLGFFQRSPFTDNELTAISQDEGGVGENSHIWRLPGTFQWANVPPRGGYPVGGSLPTATAISYLADDFIDDATLSIGVPAGSPYAGVAGRGAVVQPVYFFVSPVNLVAMYPSFRAGVVTEYDYPIEAIGAVTGFSARSVEAFDGRVCYLNIAYSGGTFPQRMWFSVVGDGTDINPGSVGAGFIDADEMPGVGLRVMRLGNMLAGYFTSGIVAYLKHQPPLAPFQLQYLTTQISVLGPRSVCTIDRDRHFIMADEGWFILDSTGSITEVGRIQTQNAGFVRKWMDDFFSNFNREKPEQVSCQFNGVLRLIRISFPSRDSTVADTVWYYEPDSDRVWPAADYSDQRVQSQLAAPSVSDPAVPWSSMAAPWSSTPGSWADYAARIGFNILYHGTRNGYVYQQDGAQGHLRQQDDGTDETPQFNYVSPQVPAAGAGRWAHGRRVEVEYVASGGSDFTLEARIDNRSVSALRSAAYPALGLAGYANLAVGGIGGTHHGIRVSGSAPVVLRRVRYVHVPYYGVRKIYGES